MKMPYAKLVIRALDRSSKERRKEIAKWLRQLAEMIERGDNAVGRFSARFMPRSEF